MHIRTRQLRRWIAASLAAAAVAVPAAQATSPDDRALYRGGVPALSATSQSPDDRPFYRGGSDTLAAASLGPDDRSLVRSVPRTEPIEAIGSPRGFDWGDAAIGGTFGLALALLVAGAFLIGNQRRRSLRSA
jgi:hypothetical protein